MEDLRSKSYDNERSMELGNNNNFPSGMQDLRCYSASYAASACAQNKEPQWNFKKGKSTNGLVSKSWSFNDPEVQRKKRVATYKAYTVEGKVKGSFKKSFRWIKQRYTLMLYGYR
ncbi:hypothetical protein ACS0TY_023948 [Phlomoides rotata]